MRVISISADAHRKRTWRRRRIVLGVLALLLSFATPKIIDLFRTSGAMLTSENYTDRPIFSFWINDFWGGNLFAMGGGGIMCCSKFEGDTAKITWILDMTKKQQIQGAVEERHEVQLSLPQRGPHDQYLHVRFDPDNKVRLGWSTDLFSPFESRPTKAVSLSSEAQ